MTVLLSALILLTAFYILITVGLTLGLGRQPRREEILLPDVSIIIAAHNEEDHISTCLQGIASQTYPAAQTQVIVVDDRSTDGTADAAASWSTKIPNLVVVLVTETNLDCPKKNALETGLAHATGSVIITTDADCVPCAGWVASTIASFSKEVGVVIGPAPLTDPGGRFSWILVFQSLLVNALAAGSAGLGIPLTCSGRNLAYQRSACDDVGGYGPLGHIIGGDDVLLMRRIRSAGWGVVYNQDPQATVASPAHLDRQWSRQIRYQSKARYYGVRILSAAMLIYIFHLFLFAIPLWAWFAPDAIPILCSVLIVKTVADGAFLCRAARRLNYGQVIGWFPIVEFLAVPYIVIFCALGTLRRPSWT